MKKYPIKRFFYDVETTGVNWRRNSIHQLAAWMEVDGVVVEKLNLHIRPHANADTDDSALAISNVTKEQVMQYPTMELQFKVIKDTLAKYVDPFDKKDKFFFVGFKNASFDDDFFKKYFELMGSKFFFYFFPSSIDVSVLATQYLINVRHEMPSFKLHRVAKTLGIEVDDTRLHEADYDLQLTREVYYVVSKFEESLF